MAEKLKSISKRISWSSLLKAAVFAVAWWALPFWIFAVIAFWLYFIPTTGAQKGAAPFWALVLASFFEPQGWLAALVFGLVFYFVLLIKDLIIIDRRGAYGILTLALSYLLIRGYFLNVGAAPFDVRTLLYGVLAAWAIGAMAAGLVKHFSSEALPRRRLLGWMAFFLTWQLLVIGTFLPLDFLYQSTIVFLVAVIFLDLAPQYVFGGLSRERVLVTGMALFALLVIVAASARWTL